MYKWDVIYRTPSLPNSSHFFTPDSWHWQAAYLKCQSQVQLSAGKDVGWHKNGVWGRAYIVFQSLLSAPDTDSILKNGDICILYSSVQKQSTTYCIFLADIASHLHISK